MLQKLTEKLRAFIDNIYVQHILCLIGIGFSLLILDVGIRYFSNQYVLIYKFTHASPLFFSISWIFFFIMIAYLLPKRGRMIFYGILTFCFNILTLAQILHMKILNRFFGVSDLFLAGEGSEYFQFALRKIDGFTIGLLLISILTMIVTIIGIQKTKEFTRNIRYYLIVLGLGLSLFFGFHFLAVHKLGHAASVNGWQQAYNVKSIYLEFNNQSKNMEVAGLYEQTFRNSYFYLKDLLNVEQDKMNQSLDHFFKEKGLVMSEKNSYTGKLKGKNLIFVLMESIDSFIVNEETMPTLVKFEKEGLNFTNRYAPTFGGGQTINSEFAANTGLYALDNAKVIYNFDTNYYPYSLANQMKNAGYTVNSIHANTAKFYNRSNFHKALGYTHHYALSDMKELSQEYDYFLDTSLVKNEEVFDFIVRDEPFMSFITTYSAHLPYDAENKRCATALYGLEADTYENRCVKNLARETDEFLRILIEKLEEKDQLDDTVLVLFTDHYMYGYSSTKKILDFKKVDNLNLIQNVPFVIWNPSLKHKEIDTIMDTADIPPTLLNLFGIEYPTNYYVGTDVFSKKHDQFVYFSDSVFYDGDLYYDSKSKLTKENESYVQTILESIREKREMNQQIILGNYFEYLEEK